MRRFLIFLAALFFAAPTFAQRTVVSGTVTDATGLPYSNGSLSVTLSLPTGAMGAYLNGAQIAGSAGPFTLDSTGSFLVQLPDNTQIKCSNAAGQIVSCAPQTTWSFAVTLSPGVSPPLGTGPQSCSATLTITGSSQSVSTSFNACPRLSTFTSNGSIGVPGQNLFYATTYGVVADVLYAASGTCANGSSTVTTGAGENAFTTAGVGKSIAGLDTPVSAGGNANCPPQGTILTFVDAHTVTVSNTPANPNNTVAFLAWGTNSGAALSAAYNASYGKGCLILPSGNMFFDVPPFISSNIATTNINYPPCVIGQYNTNLTPLPSFNISNCNVGSKACFFMYGNITSTLPNFAYVKDFEFLGGTTGSWNLTGNFSTYAPVNFNRVTAWNFWIWNIGGNSANSFSYGANFVGPNYLHAMTVFNTGTIAGCLASGSGGTSGGLNQMTTSEQSYCKGFGSSALQILTGSRLTSYGSQFDTSGCTSCETVSNDGIFTSYGDIVLGAAGTHSGLGTTANGVSYVDGSWIKGAVGGTAVNCMNSGGQVILEGADIDASNTTQPAIKTVAGCNVINEGGNKFIQGTLNVAAGTYSAPGHSAVGSCTGVRHRAERHGDDVHLRPDRFGHCLARRRTTAKPRSILNGRGHSYRRGHGSKEWRRDHDHVQLERCHLVRRYHAYSRARRWRSDLTTACDRGRRNSRERKGASRMELVWLKRAGFAVSLFLAGWYGYYAGKTNADHWWKEQPILKHALIIRPQPSEKIVVEPCAVIVDRESVVTILPDGTVSLNKTNAGVRNCLFQWVDVR
jgi:hypothetical protein